MSWHHMTNHGSSRTSDDDDDGRDQVQTSETREISRRLGYGPKEPETSRTEFDRLTNAHSPSDYPPRVMGVPCAAGPARRAPTNGARSGASSPGFFSSHEAWPIGLQDDGEEMRI